MRLSEGTALFGATTDADHVTFRVWAPKAARLHVELYLSDGTHQHELQPDPTEAGVFRGEVPGLAEGTRYKYRLDGGDAFPDPCSRYQPEGVHGPSAVVDPHAFRWSDAGWRGLSADGLALYELHIGTFTPAGTFEAAIERLDYLHSLGVNAIELLPVADFPGRWNWGYDGVALYAPSRAYGGPHGLRRLVDAAHARGLGVLLDVVYNHLGPDGNYLGVYSPFYFTDRYHTPWGAAINYDGEHAQQVREYVLQNAEHWIREYHVDGLRLDATDQIYDSSEPHLLRELSGRSRAAAGPRTIVLIAENEENDLRLVAPPEQGGYGLDAVWADDFHHAVHTLLTGEHESYYGDYAGDAEELARTVRDGFLYQGQQSRRLGRTRGTRVTAEPAGAFVFCLQNHDQIGNRALGERLHQLVPADLVRVAAAVLLFAPETPLLFMGQEFAASSPFQFFTDHDEALGRLVTEGRRAEFNHFSAFRDEALRSRIPNPQAETTFTSSRLDWSETASHSGMLALYRDLLALRRSDPVLSHNDRAATAAIAIGEHMIVLSRRFRDESRLLIANFGDLSTPVPNELLLNTPALPEPSRTRGLNVLLSTADPRYRMPGEPDGADAAPLSLEPLTVPARVAVHLG